MKYIGILGSTGSIGTQALQIIRSNPNLFKVKYLVAKQNVNLLIKQAKEFRPKYICIQDESKYITLKKNVSVQNIYTGTKGINELWI